MSCKCYATTSTQIHKCAYCREKAAAALEAITLLIISMYTPEELQAVVRRCKQAGWETEG